LCFSVGVKTSTYKYDAFFQQIATSPFSRSVTFSTVRFLPP